MKSIQKIASNFIPPILLKKLQKKRLSFEEGYPSWELASQQCSGYDAKNILEKVLASTLKVKKGEAAYERDSVLFNEIHYSWPTLAGLMHAAARNKGSLNVLDFGGSLGSSYFQNRKFLQDLPEVHWNIIEQKHYVHAGQEHIQDKQIRFYSTIEACLLENKPNVILISSVLQYIQIPEHTLSELSNAGAKILIIDRTPMASIESHQLVIQHVPASIYLASYPMWIFSRQKLELTLSNNWNIIARNTGLNERFTTSKNLEFSFEGMLLEDRQ
jgi:putative methyltransferase (TIGR04325 family)